MIDLLWFFNAKVLFFMYVIGSPSWFFGWLLSDSREVTGYILGVMGKFIIGVAGIVIIISAFYNTPASWLENLPAAEKEMIHQSIKAQHGPMSIFSFRAMQARYDVFGYTHLKQAPNTAMTNQLKAIGGEQKPPVDKNKNK